MVTQKQTVYGRRLSSLRPGLPGAPGLQGGEQRQPPQVGVGLEVGPCRQPEHQVAGEVQRAEEPAAGGHLRIGPE